MKKADKDRAKKVLSAIGLDVTTAVLIFLKTVVRERRIPFALEAPEVPNAYLRQALAESDEQIKTGDYVLFKNGQDAADFL